VRSGLLSYALKASEAATIPVLLSGAYQFEVFDGARSISALATSHELNLPPGKSVRLVASEYLLAQTVRIEPAPDKRFEYRVPELGRLTVRSNLETCKVRIGEHDLGFPPTPRIPIAAGTHAIDLVCPNNRRGGRGDRAAGPTGSSPRCHDRGLVWRAAIAAIAPPRNLSGPEAIQKSSRAKVRQRPAFPQNRRYAEARWTSVGHRLLPRARSPTTRCSRSRVPLSGARHRRDAGGVDVLASKISDTDSRRWRTSSRAAWRSRRTPPAEIDARSPASSVSAPLSGRRRGAGRRFRRRDVAARAPLHDALIGSPVSMGIRDRSGRARGSARRVPRVERSRAARAEDWVRIRQQFPGSTEAAEARREQRTYRSTCGRRPSACFSGTSSAARTRVQGSDFMSPSRHRPAAPRPQAGDLDLRRTGALARA
jgi:hypothetical protein